jgi:hypothetical protein
LSRFDESNQAVKEHIFALESKQVFVDFVHQSLEHDFCFLRHARKEVVGIGYSTFVRLAGFLSKYQPKVRLYCLDSPDTRRLGKTTCEYFRFRKHIDLQRRFLAETYQSEALEMSREKIH